jgi:hypothetical protein
MEPTMKIAMTTDELCAMARSQQKLNVWTHWMVTAVAAALAGCFLHNALFLAPAWVRMGQAWILCATCYFCVTMLRRGPRRMRTHEPCANFLEREFEDKRRGFLEIRRGVFLLIPGIAATCFGDGPVARARVLPFLVIGAVLTVVWIAFGKAAEKARRDQQDIRRGIES